jgi:hypothetical protein
MHPDGRGIDLGKSDFGAASRNGENRDKAMRLGYPGYSDDSRVPSAWGLIRPDVGAMTVEDRE